MDYTIIVSVSANESAPLQYIAPFAGCAIAEEFLEEGYGINLRPLATFATNTYKSNMILSTDISSVVGKYTTTKVYKDTLCYTAQFGALDTSNSMFTSLDLTNAIISSSNKNTFS